MTGLELFHFLRPVWLLGIPLVLLLWRVARSYRQRSPVPETFVAPHLARALAVEPAHLRRIHPSDFLALVLVLLSVAAAGPTWQRQDSPWFEETVPLFIALEVSDSMRANDLEPSRLERARFEILDLLEQRPGARTALIAYAGSAHLVLPPTRDLSVVRPFLEALDPAIMPRKGADAGAVLERVQQMFSGSPAISGSTLLFVSDGFDASSGQALIDFARRPDSPGVVALILGKTEGGVALAPDGSPILEPSGSRLDTRIDRAGLERLSQAAGIPLVEAQAGNEDTRQLLAHIESRVARGENKNSLWRDQAWWLLWPVALLWLIGFRRGWSFLA